jgi:hypothetical protein
MQAERDKRECEKDGRGEPAGRARFDEDHDISPGD